jgi:hypothetical protein
MVAAKQSRKRSTGTDTPIDAAIASISSPIVAAAAAAAAERRGGQMRCGR